ncbi:MAG: sortase [Patescibacteria group bacterium]|nr:sortase [Patescibacteria group bacterium]
MHFVVKKLFKKIILIIVSIGLVITIGLGVREIVKNSNLKNQKILAEQIKMNLPIRFKLPSINVVSNFESVGLTPDGAMDVPKGPANVAWYNLGPIPGVVGSSVLAGHSGWKNGIPAVFDNLYKVKIGDKIYVENANGQVTTFIVKKKATYKPDADAYNVFNSSDGIAHLNLITCTGDWDKVNKVHSDRLVVFADKE